jgi:hypothetical protein
MREGDDMIEETAYRPPVAVIRICAARPEEPWIRHVYADGELLLILKSGIRGYGMWHSTEPIPKVWFVFDAGDIPVLSGSTSFHEQAPEWAVLNTDYSRDYWLDKIAEGTVPDPRQTGELLTEYAMRRSRASERQKLALCRHWGIVSEMIRSARIMAHGGVDRARGLIGPEFSDDRAAEALVISKLEEMENLISGVARKHTPGGADAL